METISKVVIFLNPKLNHSNENNIITFSPLPDNLGLPFPLYLNIYWRYLLAALFLIALLQGSRLRKLIIVFIFSPETKVGPINCLILMDQINGLFLAVAIVMRITYIISPMPMSTVLGDKFCWMANFTSSLYIGGSYMWGCYIALFRVFFIKAQELLKNKIGIRNVLLFMLLTGITQVVLFAITLTITDNENTTKKMCAHLSDADLKMIDDYKVIFHIRETNLKPNLNSKVVNSTFNI
jgi:hypothetical protein